MTFLFFAGVLLLTGLSLFGWGRQANRLAGYRVKNVPVTIMCGLAVIIFLGGVVNLLHVAYGWMLDLILLGGLPALVFPRPVKPLFPRERAAWLTLAVLSLVILVFMGYTVNTQLPPAAYNMHDDFEKYFAHPVRMLQTGTLQGSPLNALGLAVLGGQALLHAMVLNHFSITYLNGVDAVFGLFMCLVLSVSFVPLRPSLLPLSVASLLLVMGINPQYVNISALYLSSAFIMSSLLMFSGLLSDPSKESTTLPPASITGLTFAAICALKSNYALFPLLLVIFQGAALAARGEIRPLRRWCATTFLYSLLFLSPWILSYLPDLLAAKAQPFFTIDTSAITVAKDHLRLFSFSPIGYGASFGAYTLLAAASLVPVTGLLCFKAWDTAQKRVLFATTSANCLAVLASFAVTWAMAPVLLGYLETLRYAIPFLIGGIPVLLTIFYCQCIDHAGARKIPLLVSLLVVETAILVLFSGSFVHRIYQAGTYGNVLSFSHTACLKEYREYNDEVLYGKTRGLIEEMQRSIPAGQPVLAWVSTPFYLDYRRNPIFDADPMGITNPWACLPAVKYVIMEYNGFATRPVSQFREELSYSGAEYRKQARSCLSFRQKLDALCKNGEMLYNDGKTGVVKLAAAPPGTR
jgi:hypothetical protein